VTRPLDFTRLRRTSLYSRASKVSFRGFGLPPRPGMSFARFLEGLPDYLAVKDFRAVVEAIARARRRGAPVLLGIGAHFIKVGLSPLLLQGIRDGVFTAVAMNGAGVVHDVELALAGKTSEDVAAHLQDGSFGMAGETARFVHAALAEGIPSGLGFGASVGKAIASSKARYRKKSLLGEAYRLGVPVTVHVAVGATLLALSWLLTLRAWRCIVSFQRARERGFLAEQVVA